MYKMWKNKIKLEFTVFWIVKIFPKNNIAVLLLFYLHILIKRNLNHLICQNVETVVKDSFQKNQVFGKRTQNRCRRALRAQYRTNGYPNRNF